MCRASWQTFCPDYQIMEWTDETFAPHRSPFFDAAVAAGKYAFASDYARAFVLDRFGGIVDWTGYEPMRASSWQRQLHIFLYPFYYVEYGIAQLGALQIWRHVLTDRAGAVRAYRRALALGGARPLPELFAAADLRFDFSAATLEPLMAAVREELGRLAP